MRSRHGVFAALPLALVLGLTGCGSGDGGGGGDGGGDGTGQSLHDDQLRFAACLRDHGVDIEDPKPGEGLQIDSTGEDKERTDAAVEACQDLLPPPDAEFEQDERDDMLAYAQCMRDNGVEAFADPQPGAGIDVGPDVFEDPDFERAQETCDAEAGGAPDRHEHTNGG